jgi:ComF family protein
MDAAAERTSARSLLDELLDALYPRACLLCRSAAGDGFACGEHRLGGSLEGPRCDRCALALPPALPDGARCSACKLTPPGFSRVVALADYRSIAPWILAFKHGGRRDLAEPLGALLAERWEACVAPGAARERSLLVPIPLHPLRRLERGYDQAWLIARSVQAALDVPAARVLARSRHTPVQGAPGSVSRAANVRGAFRGRWGARRALDGREAWLVDDVLTSGATASECARALKRLGAASVGVLCLARAGEARSAPSAAGPEES